MMSVVACIDEFAIDSIASKCRAAIVEVNSSFRERERDSDKEIHCLLRHICRAARKNLE